MLETQIGMKDAFSRLMDIRPNTGQGNRPAWGCPHTKSKKSEKRGAVIEKL